MFNAWTHATGTGQPCWHLGRQQRNVEVFHIVSLPNSSNRTSYFLPQLTAGVEDPVRRCSLRWRAGGKPCFCRKRPKFDVEQLHSSIKAGECC